MINKYDVVVIGSGFGGAMAAYKFSKAGYKTLLLEKGSWAKRDKDDWIGKKILITKKYRDNTPLLIKQYDDKSYKPLSPNEMVGGMSVFYGGASIRLKETDFAKWPISYNELAPYYDEAEKLLEVHSNNSKKFPSINLSNPAKRIFNAGIELGFKPMKIPLAINFTNKKRPICIKCITCDGFPCKIEAKNDLSTTVLKKAQEKYGLTIIANVIVDKVIEKNGEIDKVVCVDKATKLCYTFSPEITILSAGAIQSAALLLRSNLERFDHHQLIGKYVMRHCNSLVSYIFPFKTNPKNDFHKQLYFEDFYEKFRAEYGTSVGIIQDFYTPSAKVIKHFAPIGLKNVASTISKHIQNLLCIAEDDPNINNTVSLEKNKKDEYGFPRIKVNHQYSKDDYERRDFLVEKARNILKEAGGIMGVTNQIETFSHVVGSVRFGNSKKTSVLTPNCRFRGINNLYVLDGSFFPTSGGVNPSLTIAANSLRVASNVIAKLKKGKTSLKKEVDYS